KTPTATTPPVKEKKDPRLYFYALGRRKTAVAQVRLISKGSGDFTVNDRKLEAYFFGTLIQKVLQPLKALGVGKSYDVVAKVNGGGMTGQADAVSHGLARALALLDEAGKTTLKRAGFLTRDARVKERKKFGLKKARRSPQWS